MKMLYTANGRYIRCCTEEGTRPVIIVCEKEYEVDVQEFMLWSILNWRILREDEIGSYYEKMVSNINVTIHRSWQDCVQRLLVRGLIVAGTGDTEYDALYDLLACRFIIPIGAAWPLRVLSFLKLTFLEGISWKITRRLFHVDARSSCEKKVIRLARQTPLSCAEIIKSMLPGAIFGTLTQPSTAINNDLEVASNVIQLRNAVTDILQEVYENTLAEIESERASLTYSDVVDSVGGHVSYNASQLISMYCAYQGKDDYTKISLADLSAQVQAHQSEYYTYTTSEEVHTEPVQKEVRGQTITVQEDHTYTVFTLSYVGDDYFADTVWQLDDKQKSYADSYAHNLTVYLHEIEEREDITILGQINDSLIDDTSPAPGGGFGNPFNDPNWEQHITSFFGKREDVGIPGKDTTNHNGLDIAYPYGTPILAVEGGTVIKSGYHVSYGNYLVINHGGGYCTLYAHCSQLLAQVGDTVNKYDTIAKVGATGDVTGNHLHICVIVNGVYVNPKGYLH